jgi:hypothetical protein
MNHTSNTKTVTIPTFETYDDMPPGGAFHPEPTETYINVNAFPTDDGEGVILSITQYPSSFQINIPPELADRLAIRLIQASHIAGKIAANVKPTEEN